MRPKPDLGETVPIKYKSMEELARGNGRQHPTTPPPGPVPEPAVTFKGIVKVLQRPRANVYRDRQTQLVCRINAQGEAGKAGAHRRSELGGQ